MNGLTVNKLFKIIALILVLPVIILPKDYNIKFHFYEDSLKGTVADLDKVKIKLISNIGNEQKLKLRKGSWFHFKKRNPLKIKHDFLKKSYDQTFNLVIKYTGKNKKWQPIEIKLRKEWFQPRFSKVSIKNRREHENYYWTNEFVELYNLDGGIYDENNAYVFNVFFKNKRTVIKGSIVDGQDQNRGILYADIKLEEQVNKKLMGKNYKPGNNSATTRSDGSFLLSLDYKISPDSLDFTPYLLISRDGYVPQKKTFKFKSIGDTTNLKIYLLKSDFTRPKDCKKISAALEWKEDCMDCSCTDTDLKWYPEKSLCAKAECEEGEVKQWSINSSGEWEIECVPKFGLNTGPSEFVINTCKDKIKGLKRSISDCDPQEAYELVDDITSKCYRECLDIPTASLIAKTLYINIIKPVETSSEPYIKMMVLEDDRVSNNQNLATDLHKAIAWYQHINSLDWNSANIDNPVTLRAEVRYQQAVLHTRLAEILIKEYLINNQTLRFSLFRYRPDEDQNKSVPNGGKFEVVNDYSINTWKNMAISFIKKYNSVKQNAEVKEMSYNTNSLQAYMEFLEAVTIK